MDNKFYGWRRYLHPPSRAGSPFLEPRTSFVTLASVLGTVHTSLRGYLQQLWMWSIVETYVDLDTLILLQDRTSVRSWIVSILFEATSEFCVRDVTAITEQELADQEEKEEEQVKKFCSKWNLVWTSPKLATPIEANEVEVSLPFHC